MAEPVERLLLIHWVRSVTCIVVVCQVRGDLRYVFRERCFCQSVISLLKQLYRCFVIVLGPCQGGETEETGRCEIKLS